MRYQCFIAFVTVSFSCTFSLKSPFSCEKYDEIYLNVFGLEKCIKSRECGFDIIVNGQSVCIIADSDFRSGLYKLSNLSTNEEYSMSDNIDGETNYVRYQCKLYKLKEEDCKTLNTALMEIDEIDFNSCKMILQDLQTFCFVTHSEYQLGNLFFDEAVINRRIKQCQNQTNQYL